MNLRTRKIVFISLLSALAYVSVFIIRVPFFDFLTFEPKDSIITIAGLISGPIASIMISVVVSFVEMLTISSTGFIGFILNIVASLSFVLPVTMLYKRSKSFKNLLFGLLLSAILMTIAMVIWNVIVTPLYLGVTVKEVINMLVPVFIPFNLIKSLINSVLVIVFYKTIYQRIEKTGMFDIYRDKSKNNSVALFITFLIIVVTLVIYIFVK